MTSYANGSTAMDAVLAIAQVSRLAPTLTGTAVVLKGGTLLSDAKLLLKRLVAFSLMMQSGGGILVKVPDYILSKYKLIMQLPDQYLTQPLDSMNKAKFAEYMEQWKRIVGE